MLIYDFQTYAWGLSAVTLAPSYLANNFSSSAKLASVFLSSPAGRPDRHPIPLKRFFTALSRGAGRRTEDLREFIRQIKMSLGVYIGRERGDFNKTLDCKVQIEGGRLDVTRVSEARYRFFQPVHLQWLYTSRGGSLCKDIDSDAKPYLQVSHICELILLDCFSLLKF